MAEAERYPDVASRPALRRFAAGLRFAASGLPFAANRPAVLRAAILPMVIQTALCVAALAFALPRAVGLAERLGPEPGHWYSFFHTILLGALVVVVAAITVLLAARVGSIVCDPVYDVLSERTEEHATGCGYGDPFSWGGLVAGVLREIVATLVCLCVYLPVAVALFALGFVVPVVPSALAMAWTWMFLAFDLTTRSAARHGVDARARISMLFAHKALFLGFGAGAWIFLFVPFSAPFLVVGATRLYLALAAHEHAPSRMSEVDRVRVRATPLLAPDSSRR